ncbi:MAG: hypothetical protein WD358_03330 [Nitriliruptoraceae bacterium]
MSADVTSAPATSLGEAQIGDPRGAVRSLLVGTVVTLSVTATIVAVVAGFVAGTAGVVGALIGVGLVLVLFAGSAGLLLITVSRNPSMALAVLVGGAFVRLAVYGSTLVALARVEGIHRPSLAIATGVAIAIALVQEMRALARTPRLYWVDASTPDGPVPSATRS